MFTISHQEKANQRQWEGTSLVVLWLRLHAPNAGGLGSVPCQGTRSHMLQLRVCMLQLRPSAIKFFFLIIFKKSNGKFHFIPIRMAIIKKKKKQTVTNVEELELSNIAGGNARRPSYFGKQSGSSSEG